MHPSVTNQRLLPTMKFSSVATWFAAGLLMSAQQASAVHKDENGANVYTEQDMNAMLSPAAVSYTHLTLPTILRV